MRRIYGRRPSRPAPEENFIRRHAPEDQGRGLWVDSDDDLERPSYVMGRIPKTMLYDDVEEIATRLADKIMSFELDGNYARYDEALLENGRCRHPMELHAGSGDADETRQDCATDVMLMPSRTRMSKFIDEDELREVTALVLTWGTHDPDRTYATPLEQAVQAYVAARDGMIPRRDEIAISVELDEGLKQELDARGLTSSWVGYSMERDPTDGKCKLEQIRTSAVRFAFVADADGDYPLIMMDAYPDITNTLRMQNARERRIANGMSANGVQPTPITYDQSATVHIERVDMPDVIRSLSFYQITNEPMRRHMLDEAGYPDEPTTRERRLPRNAPPNGSPGDSERNVTY